ncbi:MFS general substrate transporter [Cylindrobasidium torrendii FP15055 ss-10]|uniref:MFS general substrate transporter n=1 Tax=Cylindrobasidium torrendii FP15055 ss-10 TaxID=1314674 RepID=A0A0D7BDI6_9AGAR|nr:MFS general substrate transporter [Cylindrobasidium torrendii FP15055 ss-10]
MTGQTLPGQFSLPRMVTFIASLAVALGAGTNYVYSAYAPQLGERLNINHTNLNLIGLAGNLGVYSTGPIWGKVVDSKGPKIPLALAFILLFSGYSGIRHIYDQGLLAEQSTISSLTFWSMLVCAFMTGAGGNGGNSACVNAIARTFSEKLRASATGIVLSGYGLSAFLFSTVAHFVFPGDTSSFLLVLSMGTALPMIAGFFLVRTIPLAHVDHVPPPTIRQGSRTPLLREDPDEFSPRIHERHPSTPIIDYNPVASVGLELSPTRSMSPTIQTTHKRHRSESAGARSFGQASTKAIVSQPPPNNIYGVALWCNTDFWLFIAILSFLSGTGLMYINNVGSMAQALYAFSATEYSPKEAAEWQAAQVSTVSVCNCLGRIFIGIFSDFCKHHFRIPRSYMLVFVSALVLLSQGIAASVDDIQHLWTASVSLGLAYGCIFGFFPALCIEYFGMPHFSENWGFIALAPLAGGNLFSLAFGHNLDAHEPKDTSLTIFARQCLEGKSCYLDSLYMTMGGCCVALLLSVYASWRDSKRHHAELWEVEEESDEE